MSTDSVNEFTEEYHVVVKKMCVSMSDNAIKLGARRDVCSALPKNNVRTSLE